MNAWRLYKGRGKTQPTRRLSVQIRFCRYFQRFFSIGRTRLRAIISAMASRRKNAKRKGEEDTAVERVVSSEAIRGVVAIFFFAISGFLVLASAGVGGSAGAEVYSGLSWLFGFGYLLLPLSLI